MAVESKEVPLGMEMPDFELEDPFGKKVKGSQLYDTETKGLLVVFTCNHCPYAQAVWERLIRLAKYSRRLGVKTVAINPNARNPNYPEDSPQKMVEMIEKLGIDFPYLVDETQRVAKEFGAQCTPEMYLFNSNKKLVYHGRMDDNWKDEKKVTKEELKEAIENLCAGKPISEKQYPALGCSIKWL